MDSPAQLLQIMKAREMIVTMVNCFLIGAILVSKTAATPLPRVTVDLMVPRKVVRLKDLVIDVSRTH